MNCIRTQCYSDTFGIESSNKDNNLIAERLLEKFSGELVKLHDNNERNETINIHSLGHLADQVKRFCLLFVFLQWALKPQIEHSVKTSVALSQNWMLSVEEFYNEID